MRTTSNTHGAQGTQRLATGSLRLANNYAFNPEVSRFPTGDFSVELWARTPAHSDAGASEANAFMTLLSYATHTQQGSSCARCATPFLAPAGTCAAFLALCLTRPALRGLLQQCVCPVLGAIMDCML